MLVSYSTSINAHLFHIVLQLMPTCFFSMQQIDSADPNVREAAFESIATLLKVVGERPMNMYIETIDKTKMAKVLINPFPTDDINPFSTNCINPFPTDGLVVLINPFPTDGLVVLINPFPTDGLVVLINPFPTDDISTNCINPFPTDGLVVLINPFPTD